MKKQKQRKLRPGELALAVKASRFFPMLPRGHGSQHHTIRDEAGLVVGQACNAKNCAGRGDRNHRQSRLESAVTFVIGVNP